MLKSINENYKFIISLVLIIFVFSIRFPYYIDAPGGVSDIGKKIEIDGYDSTGSFNLTYVKEYRATIPTLLLSYIKKDWKVFKKEQVLLDTEDDKMYSLRDKILIDESVSDAIYASYTKANKKIDIISNRLLVTYISSESKTDLTVGDEILYLNNIKVTDKKEITNVISDLSIGDKINIKVKNNNKVYNRYAYIIDDSGSKKIGILISNINEYDTDPKINVKLDSNESGSSGGLIMALYIYNSLVPNDITNGMKIVGTGTLDIDGNVGSIGGIEYKLKSAEKSNADLFIVPNDENYNEAVRLKKENNYKIKIVGVSTFDEVIEYLENVT